MMSVKNAKLTAKVPEFERRHGLAVDHFSFKDFISPGSTVRYTRSLCGVHLGELPIGDPERFRRGRVVTDEAIDETKDVELKTCTKCTKIRARYEGRP